MNSYKIEAGTAQHIGNRPLQNDRVALLTSARAPGYVLAVLASGLVGGSLAPEQVLHTAKLLFDEFKPGDTPSIERVGQLLRDIVHETHLVIRLNGTATLTEPHASFAGLVITPGDQAVWAHVGDARLYHFYKGACQLRSSDAAYVAHLIDSDRVAPEAARNYRQSKLLLNVLGNSRKEPFVTVGHHAELAGGDGFLLASEGLWHFFTDAELGAAVHKAAPRQSAEMLINKAGERADGKGGNCSMAIVKLVKPPKAAPAYSVNNLDRAV